jgi:uncharacterized delta-60 repeat protein
MRIPSWLRPLVARPQPFRQQKSRLQRSFRPHVEGLENRLTPSGGLLDPTFGSGGTVALPSTTDNGANAVAVQSDGKVVVAGQVTIRTGSSNIIVQRLNPDGSLDTTFNKSGSLTIPAGSSDYPNAVALQPDGKILVGGAATTNKGTAESLVARVNPNGTLDTTFGNSKGLELLPGIGQVWKLAVLTAPTSPTSVTGVVAAADGSANGAACFEVYKLTPAGLPDQTFGSSGFTILAGIGNEPRGLAVAPSGEIYLDGDMTWTRSDGTSVVTGCLAAVTPNGALDRTFGGGAGYVLADPTGNQPSHYYDVAVQTLTVNGQPVSRIVVAGVAPDNTGQTALVTAYTPGGALDTTFGGGGSFTIHGPAYTFSSLALEADGSIVVGGYEVYTATDGTNHREMLVGHLTAGGAADPTFGPDGSGFTTATPAVNSGVNGLAIDPTDGAIVTCGWISSAPGMRQALVARFTAPA